MREVQATELTNEIGKWVIQHSYRFGFRVARLLSVEHAQGTMAGHPVMEADFEFQDGEKVRKPFPAIATMPIMVFDDVEEAVDEMNRKRGVCSNCGEPARKGECRCDDCNQIIQGDD